MWFIMHKLGHLVLISPAFANSRVITATWDEMSESVEPLICVEWARYFSRGERGGIYKPDVDLVRVNRLLRPQSAPHPTSVVGQA